MKLLRVCASNYKNCCDNFTIDFIPKERKYSEDIEYELQEIDEKLYVFNTTAFIGKNASGKTSAIELLNSCYSILYDFRLESSYYDFNNVKLTIHFYHEGYIYKYYTELKSKTASNNKVFFTDQHIYKKEYFKTYVNKIFDDSDFEEITNLGELPEDTSIIFFILKKIETRAVYFNCNGNGTDTYKQLFQTINHYNISNTTFGKIIKLFDSNIEHLKMVDEKHFQLTYQNQVLELSDSELIQMLSSGTTKGLLLYTYVVAALQNGFDLLIDEVENHFHKTLVENILSLFKDKKVNKKHASLIFTTHYCEVLDLFNRRDNIWITKAKDKVYIQNMCINYNIRPELLKSRQYYNNVFDTAVNYDDLMAFKKELM